MKKLRVKINEKYKIYGEKLTYELEGDLIILSGINGSGKSQLLNIIAKNGKEKIARTVTQVTEEGVGIPIENILLLSFRDTIDLGNDFGQFSVTYQKYNAEQAWEFYRRNVRHDSMMISNQNKTKRFLSGDFIFDNNGLKNPSWRSIMKLRDLIRANFKSEEIFSLNQNDIESILPVDFVWRNENDIIQQVGNIFYIACCERVNRQIECSKTTRVFDNEEWLKTAPWTILNQLFEELNFKYRFRRDYRFTTPTMEENPKLRNNNDIRSLLDLSDGEKAILKLALIALDEEISHDIKLILFDEYDAPLNPSLTEAFYRVINKFYLDKGIQVVITTHSPATISLAPENAQFYEMFSQNTSPKIIKVNQYDYEEIKRANKIYYDKLKNQESRIEELERSLTLSGNMLFVEDKYDQIYKIAYLKTAGIENITEENLETLFEQHSTFTIHGNFSTGGLYSQLICGNTTYDQNNKIICLFDFDAEGYKKFEDLEKKKNNARNLFLRENGIVREGLCLKHCDVRRYALMLPIPERLEKFVSEKTSSDCFIEVETLVAEEFLKTNPKSEIRSEVLCFYKVKDKQKKNFWKDLLDADKYYFDDFRILFSRIEELFKK